MAGSLLNLDGRRAAVFGVASESSLAWGVAQALRAAGAELALGYQQRFKSRVMQLLAAHPEVAVAYSGRCDVSDPAEVAAFFEAVGGPLDVLVHAVAYVNPETFTKPFVEASEADFLRAVSVSAYSLLPLVRAALPSLRPGASVMALSYIGAQRVVPNYRVMGVAKAALEAVVRELACELGPRDIRVNAISAGPVRTLSAQAINDFDEMLTAYARIVPLRRTVDAADVGNLAAFLASDLSRNITGQTLFVDAGFSILATAQATAPG
jgi:enoyl-[acyl-carrier protein] reductase I